MSRKVTPDYNLAILNPDVAKEWQTTKNGNLTAKDVTQVVVKKFGGSVVRGMSGTRQLLAEQYRAQGVLIVWVRRQV
jgi:hypothetical protein